MSGHSQERFDVVLEILDGPLKGMGEQVFRGPIVRIGASPGPGGVELTGYRGLDPRHCTITAYDGGSVAIAPVGTNQVRMAPHQNVNWKDIDPIRGPEFLSRGAAFHIGPVNRGATLRFAECRSLGVWQAGEMRSEVGGDLAATSAAGKQLAGGHGYGGSVGAGAVPAAYDARRVGQVRTTSIPVWVLGCIPMMLMMTSVIIVAMPLTYMGYMQRKVKDLGPTLDEVDFFKSVNIDADPVLKFESIKQPFYEFVMVPNMERAGPNQGSLEEERRWDQVMIRAISRSLEQHVKQKGFFRNLEAKHKEWGIVLKLVRRNKMPDLFAAIPYQESRYNSNARSWACARGYWQFMPEVAHRVAKETDLDFGVSSCSLRGMKDRWSPTDLSPPFTSRSPYIQDHEPEEAPQDSWCLIDNCAKDSRGDLELSTKAALHTLNEPWSDPEIMASGSAVQLTILAHNSGYDDSRFGKATKSNVLPALRNWNAKNGVDQGPIFYGSNILCPDHRGKSWCGGMLPAETQHYAYNIMAQHMLAVCYYAKEHGELAEFEPWRKWSLPESYCSEFKIPTKAEVKGW